MTPELLVAATGCKIEIATVAAPHLAGAMDKYHIDTPLRQAHFLPQCAYESMLFTRSEEDLHYRAETLVKVWPNRFYLPPDPPKARFDARIYAMSPRLLANVVYANRMGNGPTESDDGWNFRGRGYMQLTGRTNYAAFAAAEPLAVMTYPDVLTSAYGASLSAAWFWNSRNCNDAADANIVGAVTQKINGGQNGIKERIELTYRALAALGIQIIRGKP